MGEKGIRLNKYLSDCGICSRREGDRLIQAGSVTIDGQVAQVGQQVMPGQKVQVNGKDVKLVEDKVLLLFHKPKGVVCTSDSREPKNIISYLNYPVRLTYAGRLDKDSEGLMLLTNDGDLIDAIMRARNKHEKEYVVTVNKPIDQKFLEQMASGVPILDTITRPCKVEQVGPKSFRIVLTQGLNRQIRRMCEVLDYEVQQLVRIRVMNLKLGDLPNGKHRLLTEDEQQTLYKMAGLS